MDNNNLNDGGMLKFYAIEHINLVTYFMLFWHVLIWNMVKNVFLIKHVWARIFFLKHVYFKGTYPTYVNHIVTINSGDVIHLAYLRMYPSPFDSHV